MYMSQSDLPGPILDYASPRPNTINRLPAQSILAIRRTDEGAEIVETLSGKGEAIGAIVFAGFVILWINIQAELLWKSYTGEAIFLNVTGAVMAGLIVLVINNTWRKTSLISRPGALSLTFKSIFQTRHFAWSDEQIQSVAVFALADRKTGRLLHELRLLTWTDSGARLFTGHSSVELKVVVNALGKTDSKNTISATPVQVLSATPEDIPMATPILPDSPIELDSELLNTDESTFRKLPKNH
jgi:hypothetical protein